MKEFTKVPFDEERCLCDLEAFHQLLESKEELEEQADVKPFFEAHPHLSALVGATCGWEVATCDLVAYQYQLFGDFGCDMVVGDSRRHTFLFVEWEDGTANSLFRQQGRKATPEWSVRLERGFSQVADWFWKLDDMSRTDEFETRFGSRRAEYFGLLVIGRDSQLQHPRETNRWSWRSRKVAVDGRQVRLMTYDSLYRCLAMLFQHFLPGTGS